MTDPDHGKACENDRGGQQSESAASPEGASVSRSRIADRTSVMVSIVATASYNGVESSTRRRHISPAEQASSSTESKMRFGRLERARRARISTSTFCTDPGHPNPDHQRHASSERRRRTVPPLPDPKAFNPLRHHHHR
ncbi:hypothetical protein [Nocardia anaemiae]|uniref:hypothetical protein n=1 Tax=Nocardia anaemiae TaxID=263910 RepID=UPI0007A4A01B|nr:hypothetical protein [Nocardia anaemiae]